LYAEPFVSAGGYDRFRELAIAQARNPVYAQRYVPYAYNDNPDFNVKSFRTTNVLRWEYKPGSTLFVVWQQARENFNVPGDSASAATCRTSSASRRATCSSSSSRTG